MEKKVQKQFGEKKKKKYFSLGIFQHKTRHVNDTFMSFL